MAEISAKLVMELRKKTGAGMMECKKALVSANGDFDEAIKALREKGVAVAAKKADRIAAEGIVDTLTVDGVTAMVEVNAETDFVAKNASFREFVQGVLRTIVANKPATNEELMALPFDGTELTVEGALKDKIFTIGENMSIRRFVIVEGACGTYIHGNGAIACITKFDTENVGYDRTPQLGLSAAAADRRALDLEAHLLSALERISQSECNAFHDCKCHILTCCIHRHAYEHSAAVGIVKR